MASLEEIKKMNEKEFVKKVVSSSDNRCPFLPEEYVSLSAIPMEQIIRIYNCYKVDEYKNHNKKLICDGCIITELINDIKIKKIKEILS